MAEGKWSTSPFHYGGDARRDSSSWENIKQDFGQAFRGGPAPSAREFAKTFDPTNNNEVMQLQKLMGFTEEEQDGILGPQTYKALRDLQNPEIGQTDENQFYEEEMAGGGEFGEGFDEYGDPVSFDRSDEPDRRNILQKAWQTSRLGGGKGWFFPGEDDNPWNMK